MIDGEHTRDPDCRQGSRQEKDGAGRTRSPGNGDRLKNASSAKRAEGAKLRQGRKRILTPEEDRLKRKKAESSRAVRRRLAGAVSETSHEALARADEDDNVGTEALNRGTEAGEEAADTVLWHLSSGSRREEGGTKDVPAGTGGSHSGKLGRSAREANARAAASGLDGTSARKAAQKKLMKREFEEAARKQSAKEAANSFGSLSRKFVDAAEDLVGKIGEWISEHVSEGIAAAVLAAAIGIGAGTILSAGSGANLVAHLFGGGAVASSYTAEDDDIRSVDQDYRDLESGLQDKLDHIETDHPGYDEYQYQLTEIGHDPYDLAAALTVLYESYRPEEVQAKLREVFDRQYELTLEPETQIRTRTVTRTGHRTVVNEDGTTGTETYTYEEEEQYEYHILKVSLTNTALNQLLDDIGLNADQKERYAVLAETYGNKKYLFGDDIYSNPDADGIGSIGSDGSMGSIGSEGGSSLAYAPSGEALSDAQFASMWQEAEKYLGRAYVWGGSTPQTGFDCSGFVCWVINHSGVGNVGRTTAEGLRRWTRTIPASDREPGDIIYFQGTYDTPGASHVGIYIGDGKMIHCGDPIKISSVDSGYFKEHFLSYGRIPQ